VRDLSYPHYPWEYEIERLHADRAWDAAVDDGEVTDVVLGLALSLLILIGIVVWIKSPRSTVDDDHYRDENW
jgi:hypothetical protein